MSLSESRRRSAALSVRYTEAELDRLQAEADERGMSVGSLVRDRALNPPAEVGLDDSALLSLIADALCGGGEEMFDVHVTHPEKAVRVLDALRPYLR